MKVSKNFSFFLLLSIMVLLVSCQTRVVSPNKPMYDNSLDLHKSYRIQTKDAKTQRIEVLKVDASKIYGKNKTGEMVEIPRSEVREITKTDYLGFVIIAVAAIAAVIIVPI